MVERAIRVRPDDFGALYKILVSARCYSLRNLEPWELAFEEELYGKLARRLARKDVSQRDLSPKDLTLARQAFELELRSGKHE
jgi:hypothetical protein